MRNTRVLVGMLSVGLSFAAWSASGQETKPSDAPVAPKVEINVGEESSLPPIPLVLIECLSANNLQAEKLGLTQQQRAEISAFMETHKMEVGSVLRIQMRLDREKVKNFRLQLALTEIIDAANAKAQVKAQTFLTADQQAKLREAFRQRIQQLSVVTPIPPPSQSGMPPLDVVFSNGDLLSIVELPEIQQSVWIEREQLRRMEAVKKDAYPAARELIRQAVASETSAAPVPQKDLQSLFDQFAKDSMLVLSDEQRTQYQEIVQDRQKQLIATHASGDDSKPFRLAKPHGAITKTQWNMAGGPNAVRVTLNNAFADPDIRKKLDLTEPQQAEIAKQLDAFHAIVLKNLSDQHEANLQAETAQRERLRDLVLAHNAEYQKRLADLLTAKQTARLQKEYLKSLGWSALLKPEVAEQLHLTDEQKAVINAVFKTPEQSMTPFRDPPASHEAFVKESDEIFRKGIVHVTANLTRIFESLTPEQREKFEQLTGFKLVAPPAPAQLLMTFTILKMMSEFNSVAPPKKSPAAK